MNINLDFVPDVVIYACFANGCHHFDKIWGDRNVLDYAREYIISLLPDESCFFFGKKGLGDYKIILGNMKYD